MDHVGNGGGRSGAGRGLPAPVAGVVLLLALTPAAPAPAAAPQPAAVELHAARFYRGAGTTLFDAFCRIPFALLEPLRRAGQAWYTVQVTVSDQAGTPVRSFGWRQEVAGEVLSLEGASTVDHFTFAAPPGSYRVDVAITDSASGRVSRATSQVAAFGRPPLASDLLLSSAIRMGAEGDTVPGPGEVRKGAVFVSASPRPVLTPGQAQLYYYVELYPGDSAAVRLTARVLGSDSGMIIAAPAREVTVGRDGGVTTSGLDLTGLPPGEYRLSLEARFPDSTVTRSAEFTMAGFDTEAAVSRLTAPADEYAHLNEEQLDSLYGPLVYVLESEERGIYEGLSVQGKRNFLRRIWGRRDPTPGTALNEARDDFYDRIEEANRRFRESGAGRVAGWRTDRGRILIRHGEPDDVLRRPQSGPARPYEVWKYSQARPLKFVFMDETGLGNYVLIYTDDRREPSRPDWERLLGREAVQDVNRF